MGYAWAIPAIIITLVFLFIALGALRRRRAKKPDQRDKPIVP